MAIYLLPTPRNGHVERPLRAFAATGISTEDIAMAELHEISSLGKAERFTKWKALQVKGIQGVMRWM